MRRRTATFILVLLISGCMLVVLTPTSLAVPGWWAGKVFENGGNGTFQSPSWVVQGTGCTTPSYSTMVGQQGKINSCYITHVDAIGTVNQAEVGWLWFGTESGAPLYFAATIRNSDFANQYVWLITWFTPGSTHHYRIWYAGQGSGEQLWDVSIDYGWVGRIGSTWCAGGWSHVGGERFACGGNAEFNYCEKRSGSTWGAWTQPTNWNSFGPFWNADNDPSYEFQRVGTIPTQRGRIRPGPG
jgi:hypothetical protein